MDDVILNILMVAMVVVILLVIWKMNDTMRGAKTEKKGEEKKGRR